MEALGSAILWKKGGTKLRIPHLFIFYLQFIAKNQLQQFIFGQNIEILWISYLKGHKNTCITCISIKTVERNFSYTE